MNAEFVVSSASSDLEVNRVGRLVDEIITPAGQHAGFTRLHHACLKNNMSDVRELIGNSANVNVVAEDGTQPIHIACLLGHVHIVTYLVKSGANINAEITQAMFLKYVKNKKWCSDFGNKISLLTYAIVIQKRNSSLANSLLQFKNANFEKISRRNKTILRYVYDNKHLVAACSIPFKPAYKPFLNARDDDGFTDAHYLLHPKKYGNYRYVAREMDSHDDFKGEFALILMQAGTDMYATVNGDPDTFLINMAAYRSSTAILRKLLPYYTSINESKALHHATSLSRNPGKYFNSIVQDLRNPGRTRHMGEDELEEQRTRSKILILKDLVNRITFGLPVPEEEKKLMETLYAADTDVKNIIDNYKQHFIEGELKQTVIKYGDNSVSFYDLLLKSMNEKKFKLLVKDETFLKAFKKFYEYKYGDSYYFAQVLEIRIIAARKRAKLLDELTKVSQLRKAIPLAYECIIEIIEYLNNEELEKFIGAFYTTFSVKVKKII